MILGFGKNKKTVKELRKNQGLTAKELAEMLKVDTIDILKIDDLQLGDVPEPLRTKIAPVLTGKYMDKIPW
ncbi:transcriptional regulator [Desulfallas sp. Bu1-1]|uniref:transcriptional regulator n=1 Tax=Desulfallas sp. Bu1-1 TaxID=2787620 RepID=UPI0018A01650|nr:transcriptional regulator [Desulfallas sp. Bu1-1]MBF7084682.1 transcriptional regulator [Desulfallas sp. Bu1-1]